MSNADDLSALIENTAELGWLGRAACGSLGLDQLNMFFVDAGRTLSPEAAALCRTCPVRRECLGHAYANEIAGGYYGGVSPSRRRSLSREQALELIDA